MMDHKIQEFNKEALHDLSTQNCQYLFKKVGSTLDDGTEDIIIELMPCFSEIEAAACQLKYPGVENKLYSFCNDMEIITEMAQGVSGLKFIIKNDYVLP